MKLPHDLGEEVNQGEWNVEDRVVTDISSASLGRAIAENFVAAYTFLARARGAVRERDGITAIVTRIPAAEFNGVFRSELPANLSDEQTGAHIGEALAWLRAQGEPFTWYITHTSAPADLSRLLAAHGLRYVRSSPGMAVDLTALDEDVPAPTGLEIAPVRDERELAQWVRTSNTGFGIPETYDPPVLATLDHSNFQPESEARLFLARLHGEPVGTAALVLGGGAAGLYSIATVAEQRRQGIGALLTLTALREARQRGYRIGVLEASAMGRPVYERLGFRQYATHHAYEPADELPRL